MVFLDVFDILQECVLHVIWNKEV